MKAEEIIGDLFGETPYRMLVESIKDYAIIHLDPEGRVLSWNEGARLLFGYAAGEIIGETFSRLFMPEDVADGIPERELVEAQEKGRAEDVRWHLRRDGSRFYANGVTTALRDEAGILRGFAKVGRDATASKQMEDAKSLMVSVADASQDAIFGFDSEGNILTWSRGAEKVYGYSADEAIGMSLAVLVPPERRHEMDTFLDMIKRGEYVKQYETVRQRKDGTTFDASLTISPAKNAVGEITFGSAIVQDISERKATEETLRKSEERFSLVARATTDAVWDWDLATNDLWWNDGVRSLFGYMPDEVIPGISWWYEHIHPDDRERVVTGIHNVIDHGGEKWSDEYRFLRSDGSYATVFDRGFAVQRDGKPIRMLGAIQDVTPQKTAEERLLRRVRQAALGRDVGVALAESDTLPVMLRRCVEALVTHLDAAFARVWTLDEAEAVLELRASAGMYTHTDGAHGRVPVGKFKIGMIAAERMPHLTNAVIGDERVADQAWAEREGMIAFAGYPLVVENHLVGVMAMFSRAQLTDDTLDALASISNSIALGIVRKRAEEERERLIIELREADRLKDEFLAMLSHELRTPMTAILGWSQLIRTHKFDEAGFSRALDVIERNARAQTQLIDDLLDVSRVITGKLRLNVRSVELQTVINSAVDAVRPAAEAKSIRLQTLLDPQAGIISGDPDRLQQVVWNLLTNAVKFTSRGGRVQVRLERVNSHVEIIVSDTGRGISPEFLPLVFDRFRQADQTTTRTIGGLGLGLAIVRQLVELHGGTIAAHSDGTDCGATFTVSLPLLPLRVAAHETPERVHPTAHTGTAIGCRAELDGIHVLIVDDEEDTRDMLAVVLSECGAKVTTAFSARDALAKIADAQPDVIISDIGMPNEDGYSLIEQIRVLPPERGGAIPAVALTAYARPEDRVRALRSGFQMHVPKPVENAEVVAVVANLTGRVVK